jgi:hypothetical protein
MSNFAKASVHGTRRLRTSQATKTFRKRNHPPRCIGFCWLDWPRDDLHDKWQIFLFPNRGISPLVAPHL